MKALDKIKSDKRVRKVWKDSDGWWAIFNDGYHVDDCSGIREDSIRKLAIRLKDIKEATL